MSQVQSGFYIAWTPLFDHKFGSGNLFKVGETGDLSRRLHHDAYTTCWPDDFTYNTVLETNSKLEAQQIEANVLYVCRHYRLGTRELINLPAAEICDVATGVARDLNIKVHVRLNPTYPEHARAKDPGIGPVAVKGEKSAPLVNRELIEHLTIPNKEARATMIALVEATILEQKDTEPNPGLEEYVEELLAEVIIPAPPAAPIPSVASRVLSAAKAAATAVVKAIQPSLSRSSAALPVGEDEPLDDYIMLDERGRPLDGYRSVALETRQYQEDAAEASLYELKRSGKAVLMVCCRGGKTRIAHMVIEDYLAAGGRALWLVPGLALARQTVQKLVSYGGEVRADEILLVGSDPIAVAAGDASLVMTTDREGVKAFIKDHPRALIVSTYQSSAIIPDDAAIAITILDEAHRSAGSKKLRPFNRTLLLKRPGHQLSMTATPSYGKELSMNDTSLYGGICYRYYLADAIKAGYVNAFRVELVAAGFEGKISPTGPSAEVLLVQQIVAASEKTKKMLVFCKNIAHATRLCQAVSLTLAADHPTVRCFIAHSGMSKREQNSTLQEFAAENVKGLLFNVKLYGEGVEVPWLDSVFYAAPRHSPLDIIQSLSRPLTKVAGKPESVIFLPILVEKGKPINDPGNLERFASIVPFCDALMEEDPSLYEHLLNPKDKLFPISVLGSKSLGLTTETARKNLLAAVRKAVRYNGISKCERLTRADRIPWPEAFQELRRVVTECGYFPKTTDAWYIGDVKIAFHNFYKYCAEGYAAWRDGKPSKLQPYQLRELETLPQWELRGIEGPYPVKYCLNILERWLEADNGNPPMIEINRGGYVGLDSTDLEKLSGFMTTINQSDGRDRKGSKRTGSGFTVSPEKQVELDRICARFGLRWRKERDAAGSLVEGGDKTFIQAAHERFKAYYKAFKNGENDGAFITEWYPGYPLKHARQCRLDVPKAVLPPRWKTGRRRYKENEAKVDK